MSNPFADPDGNGVGVMLEFACNIAPDADPGNRLPRPVEVTIGNSKHQGYEWTRRKLSEPDFLLEVSSNLQNWNRDARATVEILHDVDEGSERVRILDPDPVGSHTRRFIRLDIKD